MDMQNISYHGVQLDVLLDASTEEWHRVWTLVKAGITDGTVRPLPRQVYSRTQLGDAFSSAKDESKVLIEVRSVS